MVVVRSSKSFGITVCKIAVVDYHRFAIIIEKRFSNEMCVAAEAQQACVKIEAQYDRLLRALVSVRMHFSLVASSPTRCFAITVFCSDVLRCELSS